MKSVLQDVHHGFRSLSSSPSFVLVAVVCLGLGIGANTTVFSIVNGVLLAPLPFPDPDRLVRLEEFRLERPSDGVPASYLNFRDWQEHGASVGEMAGICTRSLILSEGEQTRREPVGLVTWNLFSLLRIHAVVGRGFRQQDDQVGAPPVVLLGEGLWHDRFGSDPSVVGRSVLIDGRPHTVVGVIQRFTHPAVPGPLRSGRLWIPLRPSEHDSRRDDRSVAVIARLATGIGADRAAVRLAGVARALEAAHSENRGWGIRVQPFATSVSATTRAMLALMMGAVSFVLLIACANVGNLTLARATRRRREIAVRAALGASPRRIVSHLMTESLIVGVISAPVGLIIALWAIRLLLHSAPESSDFSLPIDARVFGFTAGLAILTSLLFGLAPALHAVRGATRDALTEASANTTTGRRQNGLRNALVIGEVALSLILLVGASLFVRSFLKLLHEDDAFKTTGLACVSVEMREGRDESPDMVAARVQDILARVGAVPGVTSATASDLTPLRGGGIRTVAIREGMGGQAADSPSVIYGGVTSRFFETLNVPVLLGRHFTDLEGTTRSAVAVVNKRMADRLWPGEPAAGKRFRLAGDASGAWFTVIGVSQNLSNWDLSDQPMATAYVPYPHAPARNPCVVIRAAGNPLLAATAARAAIQAAGDGLTVSAVQTMDEIHRLAFWRQELLARVLVVFGAGALLLAAFGLYGVLSYLVSARTREIGIRMALGAGGGDVVRLVVRQGMALVLGGVGLGFAGALATTRLIRRQLHEVSATDPASFAIVAILLAVIGLLATYVPARQAARVDPIASLRE